MLKVCPLCSTNASKIPGPDNRIYYYCNNCMLIHCDQKHHLSAVSERSRYDMHDNGIHNTGYVEFLNQVIEPAMKYITDDMVGLDYGCGPVPTLSLLIENDGYKCYNYDPIFFPEMTIRSFDFIFATECLEHFYYPENDLKKITSILKKNGFLFIMTYKWHNLDEFARWGYARDETHVSFFHQNTIIYLAEKFGFELMENTHSRVEVLRKK